MANNGFENVFVTPDPGIDEESGSAKVRLGRYRQSFRALLTYLYLLFLFQIQIKVTSREKEEKRFEKKWVVRTGEDVEVSGHRASASENGSKSKKGRMERRIGILVDWLGLRKKEGSSSPRCSGQSGNVKSKPGPGPRTAQVSTPTLQSGRMRQIAYDEDDIPLPRNWRSRCTEPSTPEGEGPSSSTTKTVTRSPVSPAGPLKPKPSTSTYTSHQQHPILIPSPNLPHKSAFSSKYPMPMRSSTPLLESQSSQLSNDYDSCDDDEERGRTAHFLFAQNRDEDFYGFEDDSGAIESPGHSAKSTPRRVRDGGGVSSTTSSHKISKGRTHAERTHPLDRRLTPNSSPVTRRHDLPLPSDLPPSFPPSMSASPRHRQRAGKPDSSAPYPTTPLSKSMRPKSNSVTKGKGKGPVYIDLTTLSSSPASPQGYRSADRGHRPSTLNTEQANSNDQQTPSARPAKRRRMDTDTDSDSKKTTGDQSSISVIQDRRAASKFTEVQNFLDSDESQRGARMYSKRNGKEKETEKMMETPDTVTPNSRASQWTPIHVLDKAATITTTAAPARLPHQSSSNVGSPGSSTRKRKHAFISRLESYSTQLRIQERMALAVPNEASPSFAAANAELKRKFAKEVEKEKKRHESIDDMLATRKRGLDEWGKTLESLNQEEEAPKRLERSEGSRLLEEKLREDVRLGRKVVIPQMICTMTESQILERDG